MPGIFDEAAMRQTLERYIPDGETLLAGIHAVSNQTHIEGVFGGCVCLKGRLVPREDGTTVWVKKDKHAPYDVYLGVTDSCLLIAQCEENQYHYEVGEKRDAKEDEVREVTAELAWSDLGTCFPLADISGCECKKGLVGSVKCNITMKNGSTFKLILPKLGGLGGGMPHHAEYREAIIARLGGKG